MAEGECGYGLAMGWPFSRRVQDEDRLLITCYLLLAACYVPAG